MPLFRSDLTSGTFSSLSATDGHSSNQNLTCEATQTPAPILIDGRMDKWTKSASKLQFNLETDIFLGVYRSIFRNCVLHICQVVDLDYLLKIGSSFGVRSLVQADGSSTLRPVFAGPRGVMGVGVVWAYAFCICVCTTLCVFEKLFGGVWSRNLNGG